MLQTFLMTSLLSSSPIDYLHGLGRREGAGLRSGPNVLAKVPCFEGFLTLQIHSSSCEFFLSSPFILRHRLAAFGHGISQFDRFCGINDALLLENKAQLQSFPAASILLLTDEDH